MTKPMKITRSALIKLIAEELHQTNNALLEALEDPIIGQEQEGDYTKNPDEYEAMETKKSLYHMARQADQLHDMITDDEELAKRPDGSRISEEISLAAKYLEAAFKAITYDKQNPAGR